MRTLLLFLLPLFHCLFCCWCYPEYLQKLPNGAQLPLAGLGHTHPAGGGALSQFGRDFVSQGMEWTSALCRMDSDGDGLTNGDELGDGCCDGGGGGGGGGGGAISHPGMSEGDGGGDCGALPCRSNKPSCGAGALEAAAAQQLKLAMAVKMSRDLSSPSPSPSPSHKVVASWSPLPPSICACSIVIRAGNAPPHPLQPLTTPNNTTPNPQQHNPQPPTTQPPTPNEPQACPMAPILHHAVYKPPPVYKRPTAYKHLPACKRRPTAPSTRAGGAPRASC